MLCHDGHIVIDHQIIDVCNASGGSVFDRHNAIQCLSICNSLHHFFKSCFVKRGDLIPKIFQHRLFGKGSFFPKIDNSGVFVNIQLLYFTKWNMVYSGTKFLILIFTADGHDLAKQILNGCLVKFIICHLTHCCDLFVLTLWIIYLLSGTALIRCNVVGNVHSFLKETNDLFVNFINFSAAFC